MRQGDFGPTVSMLTVVQRRVPRPSRLTGVGDPTVEISTTRDEDRVVLTVRGEIDMATAPMLNDALARAAGVGATEICVDLRDVGFMDSTGLHALVEIHEAIDRSRRRLVIIAPTGAARRTLELSGLMGVLNIAG